MALSTTRPLSSTSCLCKDPATVVVSIVYMQTPWCRDIHSLFPVLLEEAGGTKDYEMSFPETFCFKLFFPLMSKWCFFSPLLLRLFRKLSRPPTRCSFSHLHLSSHHIAVFYRHWFPQWNSDGGDGGIMMIPPPKLSLYCLSGWLSICQ